MKTALFIAALMLPVSALADVGATVPDRFIGHWAGSPDSCGSDADDLILRIAPHHISYWESEGPIKAAVARGDTEIALISELSGEGETWLSTAKFNLSQDGRQLIDDTTVPGQELVRYKSSAQSVRGLTIHSSRAHIRAAPKCTPSAILALSRRPAAGRLNSGVRR